MSLIAKAGLFAAIALICVGCQTSEERRASSNQSDHQDCMSYGFQPGTEGYANCRLQKAAMAEQAEQAADNDRRRRLLTGLAMMQASQPQQHYVTHNGMITVMRR